MINLKLSKKYKVKIQNLLKNLDTKQINEFCKVILNTSKNKKNIFIFGNGGSASTANHFANDMTKNAKIKTFSFSNDNLITCYSNDYGYSNWVKKVIQHYAKSGDLAIFLSVSGNSENVVKGVKFCKSQKILTYSLTGPKKKNKLNILSDYKIWINSLSYNHVEIMHHIILLMSVDILIGKDIYKTNL